MTDYLEEMAYKLQLKLELRNHPRGGQREHDLIRDALEDAYKAGVEEGLTKRAAVPKEWKRDHISMMAVSSVRYALGRTSYITAATCQAIRCCIDELDELDERDINVMIRDIREAKRSMGTIGMACDDREWMGLLVFLEQRLAKLAKREAGQLSGNSE